MYVVHHDLSFCSNSVAVGNIYPGSVHSFPLPISKEHSSLDILVSLVLVNGRLKCSFPGSLQWRNCYLPIFHVNLGNPAAKEAFSYSET
jgi:hypothetical protein